VSTPEEPGHGSAGGGGSDVDLRARVVLVVGDRDGLTGALVAAFDAAGARTARVAPVFADRVEVDAAFAAAARRLGADPDVVVHAHIEPSSLDPASLVGLAEHDWVRRCEAPIRAALWTAQASYPWLRGRDGRLVFICPTVALEGASGFVFASAAAEAQRMLAKSAARRWGRHGITVNVVAPALGALGPASGTDAARTAPALPPGPDPLAATAAAAVWLASRSAARITGATIGADDGAVMAP